MNLLYNIVHTTRVSLIMSIKNGKTWQDILYKAFYHLHDQGNLSKKSLPSHIGVNRIQTSIVFML